MFEMKYELCFCVCLICNERNREKKVLVRLDQANLNLFYLEIIVESL